MHSRVLILLPILHIVSSYNVISAVGVENPFTPKGYLIRYWKKKIPNDFPIFLLKKASPLTAPDFAAFSKLVDDQNTLSSNLPDFCAKANLLCSHVNSSPTLQKNDNNNDNDNFTSYLNRPFYKYGDHRIQGASTFKNYSDKAIDVASNDFRNYSHDSLSHNDEFTSYATKVRTPKDNFDNYAAAAKNGSGAFNNYNGGGVNKPNLHFNAYSYASGGRSQKFTEYSKYANSGDEGFTSYAEKGINSVNVFRNYGEESNVMGSTFKTYSQGVRRGKDKFNSYGDHTNAPVNRFDNYGTGGREGLLESFKHYRSDSNVGSDDFQSYGKDSTDHAEVNFFNYGNTIHNGSSQFSGYGNGAKDQLTDFKIYGVNTTFKGYSKKGVTFTRYINQIGIVEEGKFFREAMLKRGRVMHMPDIRDKMARRSFLPSLIVSKLPVSLSKISELQKIFNADNESSVTGILTSSLSECERAPSPGETKRCVASIEDMIDFSTSVLGCNVTVRTTENTQGYNGTIMIGQVKGVNGGNVTKSVSCHQSLFPFLLYYCHSVPKVRVYEADILDPKSKVKINHGVAICHLDTSSWSPGHGAFIALGSEPGKIEVCHWIFENDMTWTLVD